MPQSMAQDLLQAPRHLPLSQSLGQAPGASNRRRSGPLSMGMSPQQPLAPPAPPTSRGMPPPMLPVSTQQPLMPVPAPHPKLSPGADNSLQLGPMEPLKEEEAAAIAAEEAEPQEYVDPQEQARMRKRAHEQAIAVAKAHAKAQAEAERARVQREQEGVDEGAVVVVSPDEPEPYLPRNDDWPDARVAAGGVQRQAPAGKVEPEASPQNIVRRVQLGQPGDDEDITVEIDENGDNPDDDINEDDVNDDEKAGDGGVAK